MDDTLIGRLSHRSLFPGSDAFYLFLKISDKFELSTPQ